MKTSAAAATKKPKKYKTARPKADGAVRVYSFWCEPASAADAKKVTTQLEVAAQYRRRLTAIENDFREKLQALAPARVQRMRRELREAGVAVRALEVQIRAAPAQAPALAQLLEQQRAQRQALDDLKKAIRLAWREFLDDDTRREARQKKIAALRASADQAIRDARGEYAAERPTDSAHPYWATAPLYWGTYLCVEDAHKRACVERPLYKFLAVPWNAAEGTIAVQLQAQAGTAPTTFKDLLGVDDRRVQIDPTKYALTYAGNEKFREAAHEPYINRHGNVRPKRLQELRLRVGSTGPGNRTPIWAAFHVLLHRDIPADAQIKWVKIQRRMYGDRARYQVQFTAVTAHATATAAPAAACGIDIGWRQTPNGVRVAVAVGSDGHRSELVVDPITYGLKDKAAGLQQLRDKKKNAVQDMLNTMRKLAPGERAQIKIEMDVDDVRTVRLQGLSEKSWLRAELEHVHVWHKTGRYVRLAARWVKESRPENKSALSIVQQWLQKEHHLWLWQAFTLRKMQNVISTQYMMWAVEVAKRYTKIGFRDFDIKRTREADSRVSEHAARVTQAVAPGRLKLSLKQAATKFGRELTPRTDVEDRDRCTACGEDRGTPPYKTAQCVLRCKHCGHEEDQDHATATNILLAIASIPPPAARRAPLEKRKTMKSKAKLIESRPSA